MAVFTGFYPQVLPLSVSQRFEGYQDILEHIPIGKMNAHWYLHGLCADFAAMLSKIYGYRIVTLHHWRHDDLRGKLIHAYCVADFEGTDVMIDVRGITSDYELFFSEFDNECTYYPADEEIWDLEGPVRVEVWNNKDELFDSDYEGWTDLDVRDFIEAYDSIYSVAALSNLNFEDTLMEGE